MNTLIVRHVPGDEPRFHVVRGPDGKQTSEPAAVLSPRTYPVEGRPHSDLIRELRWYLEEFLAYPFSPNTERADHVLDALKAWGRQAFDALFDNRQAGKFLDEAAADRHYDQLHLQISSDDPAVLAWPWEALRDSAAGLLAQQCQIDRRLNQVLDPQPLDERLPRDRVNILLVTARPYEGDVRYRSISRPLVELIAKERLPAHVTVLRPPTFGQLRRHLREHAGHYHILHFDGHGAYGPSEPGTGGAHLYDGSVGCLVFEDATGKPDEITADRLSHLLRESAVPAVVLNACQSASLDERAEDPFASVAAALVQSGTRSVVAMAYSLYVSGAQEFLPAFYERLFDSGDVAQAVRAGRQKMHEQPKRVCARGRFPLQDWLVPVVYQQDPLDFSFAAEAKKTTATRESKLPEEARDENNPYGFIGRDGALLALERAMLRPPAGILITGLGGVGKTTLARGFVKWLEDTEGIGHGCMWFTFTDIRSAEFVINRIGEALLGSQFSTGDMDTKLDALAAELKDNRVVIVWDNFEVARGIPGTSVTANLTDEDGAILRRLLKKLRGGASKVIITSRSREEWLGHTNCFELPIGGLVGDDRWEYCEVVLNDLNIQPSRDDPAMVELMKLLDGHTLAMRAILPKLNEKSASTLAAALRTNLDDLDLPEDDVSASLAATLRFIEQSLPDDQRPLLIPLSLYEGFVDANFLEQMAKPVNKDIGRPVIDRFTGALCFAGLLRDLGQATFEMHPALTAYLRASALKDVDRETHDAWTRAFVDTMGSLADAVAPRPLHEQRIPYHIHGANFHHALSEAERLGMDLHFQTLLQSLGAYAQNTRDFAGAARLFVRQSEASRRAGHHEGEAAAYHQLGMIAEEQRDFASAEQWYLKSLAIAENLGDEHARASTYHQLGTIAQEHRDFPVAKQWYHKSLEIEEKQGNEDGAAISYHQLGRIAQEQRDFANADKLYRKALAIKEKLGDEEGAATTYHQLGRIAEEQRDFASSEQWYHKSLAISEKQGNEHGAAKTYHQLGRIAEEQRDFASAGPWYREALAINEKQGNAHGAAANYGQLGTLAGLQGHFEESAQWLIKCIQTFAECNDQHNADGHTRNVRLFYEKAPSDVQRKMAAMWREAGLGELPSGPPPDESNETTT